jgi:modulator of FtsH protease
MEPTRYGFATTADRASLEERLGFLRRVYALFFLSLLVAGTGAVLGLLPPIFSFTAQSPGLCALAEIGLLIACQVVRRRGFWGVGLMLAFTFVSGLVLSPYLVLMAYRAGTPAVIGEAFATTCLVFGGLSAYTLVSRQDFTWLRGFAVSATLALLGVGLLDVFFFHSDAVQMAMSASGVLIFSCWVLYDTSRILRTTAVDDAVGGAIRLYLDFVNLFVSILRLLSGRRR